MKKVVFLLAAGLVLFCASGVYADTVTIGAQAKANGSVVVPLATIAGPGSGAASFACTSCGVGVFSTIDVFGSGTPPAPEPDLFSNSIDVTAGTLPSGVTTEELDLFVTEQGLSSPVGVNTFESAFTSNLLTGDITSVVESTYIDTSNGLFTTPFLLGTETFTATGISDQFNATPSLAGPYSETEVFQITATGSGSANDTIDITQTTPEPGTMALFGSGLIGLAGLLRRKLMGTA